MAMQKVVVHWVRKYYQSLSFWELGSYLHFLSWVKGFFFSICNQIFPFVTDNTL